MKKTTQNIVIAIVITIILFALICVVYQQFRKQPIEQDKLGVGEVLPDANNGLDDMLDNILDSNIESNGEKNNDSENNSIAAAGKETVADENAMTPKEAKAISLVKDKWTEKFGNTDGIDFNISIQNDGKYLVTVYDTKTTQTISGYIVDVTTGIINEK